MSAADLYSIASLCLPNNAVENEKKITTANRSITNINGTPGRLAVCALHAQGTHKLHNRDATTSSTKAEAYGATNLQTVLKGGHL